MNVDGTDVRRVTDENRVRNGNRVAFSPDSQRLVFAKSDGLYTVGIDGSNLRRLGGEPGAIHPVYSPDEHAILYAVHKTPGAIRVMNSDGSNDRKIKHTRDDIVDCSLFVMNADGGDVKQLTEAGSLATYPVWRPR